MDVRHVRNREGRRGRAMKMRDPRIHELHKIVESLEKKGWVVEKAHFHDDIGEPFRFRLQVRYDPPKPDDVL